MVNDRGRLQVRQPNSKRPAPLKQVADEILQSGQASLEQCIPLQIWTSVEGRPGQKLVLQTASSPMTTEMLCSKRAAQLSR